MINVESKIKEFAMGRFVIVACAPKQGMARSLTFLNGIHRQQSNKHIVILQHRRCGAELGTIYDYTPLASVIRREIATQA